MTWLDWWLFASGAAWVLGGAIVLSAASWAWWLAGEQSAGLRAIWTSSAWPGWHARGMVLVAAGFGTLPGAASWERLLWAVVALAFLPASVRRSPPVAVLRSRSNLDREPTRSAGTGRDVHASAGRADDL